MNRLDNHQVMNRLDNHQVMNRLDNHQVMNRLDNHQVMNQKVLVGPVSAAHLGGKAHQSALALRPHPGHNHSDGKARWRRRKQQKLLRLGWTVGKLHRVRLDGGRRGFWTEWLQGQS
jgi:hypothetical protein